MSDVERVTGPGYELIRGDCLQVLPGMANKWQMAVVADPPYGIAELNKFGSRNKAAAAMTYRPIIGDDQPFNPGPWLPFPYVVLWGANWYADKLPPSGGWLIWDKRDGITSNNFSDCEMAWTNCLNVTRLFRHRWYGMIRASEQGEQRVHSTQKAVALMSWVLEVCEIPKTATIFDPYLGSGTTGVAAIKAGYRFIGCEIDPHYFAIAARRIADAARAAAGENKILIGDPIDYQGLPIFNGD